MTAKEVTDFVIACLAEAEADAYQQQEGDAIHDIGVEWYRHSDRQININVGTQGFKVKVSKL